MAVEIAYAASSGKLQVAKHRAQSLLRLSERLSVRVHYCSQY